MGLGSLLRNIWRQNTKVCIICCVFLVAEILLVSPDYGTLWPVALAGVFAILLAATVLNRYFWVRIFRPMLQLAGAERVYRSGRECCCCCCCRKNETTRVRLLRAFFVLVYVGIYAITLSAVALEQVLGTKNGRDPHPWMYFSFQWAGGFVLMLVSAWFVDMFVATLRTVAFFFKLYKRQRLDDRFDKVHQRFALPLWAFPVMWAVTFVVLVSVSSAMGAGDPVVRTVEVPLPNLPVCLDGYSLGMISDIHAGPTVGRAEIARHAEKMNSLGADAIVMVGDLVDDQVEDIGAIVDPVADFSAPDGQYFAQGNHEHYTGQAQDWADFVAARGFTVLNDTRVTLPLGVSEADPDACYFYLAGVDDFESAPDYDAALGGRDESIATVLLAHEPIQVMKASEWLVGLQLSGHTHGGQVFPYHVLAWLNQAGYVSGLHKKKDTYLYVSEGAVGWGPRMRLLSTTEYTLVILRSPEKFSDPDLNQTASTRATGAAGMLLIFTFIYCLGYPILKACRRAAGEDGAPTGTGRSTVRERERNSRDSDGDDDASMRRRVADQCLT